MGLISSSALTGVSSALNKFLSGGAADAGVPASSGNSLLDKLSNVFSNTNTSAKQGRRYQASPKFAHKYFGQNNQGGAVGNRPVLNFQYFVKINFNKDPVIEDYLRQYDLTEKDSVFIQFLVKDVRMPDFKVDTEKLNQYNKRVISQTKVEYGTLGLDFYDVVSGQTQKIWQAYYNYYFQNGRDDKFADNNTSADIEDVNTRTHNPNYLYHAYNPAANFGFAIDKIGDHQLRNLIESIDIYQFIGDKFKIFQAVNPRIETFKSSDLTYEGGEVCLLNFEFSIENLLIQMKTTADLKMDPETAATYRNMLENNETFDLKSFASLATAVGGAGTKDTSNAGETSSSLLEDIAGQLLGSGTKIIDNSLNRVSKRVETAVRGLPSQISNSVVNGIMTGKFKFTPQLDKVAKNIAKTEINKVKGDTINSLAVSIKSAGKDIIDSVIGGKSQGGVPKQPQGRK